MVVDILSPELYFFNYNDRVFKVDNRACFKVP